MKKIVVVSVAVLVLVGVGGYFGVSYWARHQAEAQIEQALAGIRATGAKASIGTSDVSLRERSLTLTDLSITSANGDVVLTVGKVAAQDAAPPQGERISAGRVALDDILLTLRGGAGRPQIVHTVPHLAISRYSGPLLPKAVSGESDLMGVIMAQLATLSADEIAAPRTITRVTPTDDADGAEPQEITAESVTLSKVRDGLVGQLTITRLATEPLPDGAPTDQGSGADQAEDQGDTVRSSIRDIVLTDLDVRPLLASGAAGSAFVTVVGKAQTGAMTVEVEDGRTEIAGVTLTGLALQPDAFTPQRAAALTALSDPANQDTPATPQQLDDATAVLRAVRFATFEARGLRTTEPGGNGQIAAVTLEKLDAGVLSRLSFDGMEGEEDGRFARIGRLAIDHVDLARSFRFARSADPMAPDAALAAFRLFSGFTLNNMVVPVANEDGSPGDPVRVGTIALSWGDLAGDLPTRIRFDLTDVSGPIHAEDGEPFATLAAAGLTNASVSLAFGAAYDAASSSVRVAPVEMEVRDAFRLKVETTLTQLPAAALASEEAFTNALPGINLGTTSLSVTDLGLAKLVLQRLAEAEGLSVEDYRAGLAQLLEQIVGDMAKTNPEAADVGAALAAFIQNPHTLTLTATPKGPVPLMALMNSDDPEVPLQLFTISATNTP